MTAAPGCMATKKSEEKRMKCLVIDYIDEEFAGRRTSMSSPLIGCDRFIVSPHSGGQTKDAVYKISRYIFDKCSEALHFEKA